MSNFFSNVFRNSSIILYFGRRSFYTVAGASCENSLNSYTTFIYHKDPSTTKLLVEALQKEIAIVLYRNRAPLMQKNTYRSDTIT